MVFFSKRLKIYFNAIIDKGQVKIWRTTDESAGSRQDVLFIYLYIYINCINCHLSATCLKNFLNQFLFISLSRMSVF